MATTRLIAAVMAGGVGKRLMPLTAERAKPAVPFGGIYRIVDFILSNCLHSGIRQILVLTQYKSDSLNRHLIHAWYPLFPPSLGYMIEAVPPQQWVGERWYAGTADSVYQSFFRVRDLRPEHVAVLAGDHIYKMDIRRMFEFHVDSGADATVSCIEAPVEEAAGAFGVAVVGPDGERIVSFEEKPQKPTPIPGRPDTCLASMGIYIFRSKVLDDVLEAGPGRQRQYDFGTDILPSMVAGGARVCAWQFRDERGQPGYWRDVGTVDALYEANMDLVRPVPRLNLYDDVWPIIGLRRHVPPAKFVFAQADAEGGRRGEAHDSLVSSGVIVSGGRVKRSVLSPRVRVNSFASVEDSVLHDNVDVGRYAILRRAIVDKGVRIPAGEQIGVDLARDRARFTVSDRGIVVIPKNYQFEPRAVGPRVET
ncbi:glucose-1-phosphate adenylyltransferase [Myxococcota bacterium]|nr:glucose-1-phosphate adenylyltransferase [Myxococcota bacterium]